MAVAVSAQGKPRQAMNSRNLAKPVHPGVMAMHKKLVVGLCFVVTAGMLVFTWMDTAPYRQALAKVPQSMPVADIQKGYDEATLEATRFTGCTGIGGFGLQYSAEERACLIQAMDQTTGVMGAIMYGTTASTWVRHQPADEEIRAAALRSIERGRAAMVATKAWAYDAPQALAKAHDQSLLLRLAHGRMNTGSRFVDDAQRLDTLEFSLLMPAVSYRQSQWLKAEFISK
ncbi:hypothetical protein DV532_26005 (plasmid) [Pseudomonas sp. Leaf58]|nr:hypothetical protein DV532_26005 [Pseudomonas sp. Leaf58]